MTVAFDAASTGATAPFSKLRLALTQTAAAGMRPGKNFAVAGAALERGAFVTDVDAGPMVVTWDL